MRSGQDQTEGSYSAPYYWVVGHRLWIHRYLSVKHDSVAGLIDPTVRVLLLKITKTVRFMVALYDKSQNNILHQ